MLKINFCKHTPKLLFIISSIVSLQATANDFFAKADAIAGKALLEKHCISCRASQYGDDGSAIYTREYNKVKTSSGLLAQILNRNTMIGLNWFDNEELNVASYLNKMYYKFDY